MKVNLIKYVPPPPYYPLGTDINGAEVYRCCPQGNVVRIDNFVRLVRDAN